MLQSAVSPGNYAQFSTTALHSCSAHFPIFQPMALKVIPDWMKTFKRLVLVCFYYLFFRLLLFYVKRHKKIEFFHTSFLFLPKYGKNCINKSIKLGDFLAFRKFESCCKSYVCARWRHETEN